MLDERRRHPHRRRPGAVGRADRLDHFLEHRRAAQHPARSLRGPGELRILRRHCVEAGQVLVQVQDSSQDAVQPLLRLASEPGSKNLDACRPLPFAHDDGARLHAGDGKRRRERPFLLVHAHRRQVGDAVRHQRPPEVDRLSGRACERDGQLRGRIGHEMQIFLETERLVLRRFTGDDVDNLVELDSDPEVMRFITRRSADVARGDREASPAGVPRLLRALRRSTASGPRSRSRRANSSAGSTSGRPKAPPTRSSSATGCAGRPGERAMRPKARGH